MDENSQSLISVIVPIYKVEKHLERCVESIRHQTMRELEIILVDDGSPDRCSQMCDEYASKDCRITVVHKENGGLSDARNAGIEMAKTNLIAFIDSDDYIDLDMMEFLYRNLINANADISVCGLYHHSQGTISTSKDTLNGYYEADQKEAIRLELTELPVTAVNKLYKKTLFEKVHFPKGKLYEDSHTIIPLLFESHKVVYDMKPKYHYIHRENSITTKPYRPEVASLIEANLNNKEMICKVYPELHKGAEYRYYWSNFWVLECMLKSPALDEVSCEQKKNIIRLLKKKTGAIVLNPFFTNTRKVSAILLFLSYKLYEKVALMYMSRHNLRPISEPR